MMKIHFNYKITFIIFFSLSSACTAQHSPSFFYNNYKEEDGLNAKNIYKIVSDVNNNIWIATDNGLFMFNGLTFEKIKLNTNDQDIVNVSICGKYIIAYNYSYDIILFDPETRRQKSFSMIYNTQKDFVRYRYQYNGYQYWFSDSINCFIFSTRQLSLDSSLKFKQTQLPIRTFLKKYKKSEEIIKIIASDFRNTKIIDSFILHKNKVFLINNGILTQKKVTNLDCNNITAIKQIEGSIYVSYSNNDGIIKHNFNSEGICNSKEQIFKTEFITDFILKQSNCWISSYSNGLFQTEIPVKTIAYKNENEDLLYVKALSGDSLMLLHKSGLEILKHNRTLFKSKYPIEPLNRILDVISYKNTYFIISGRAILQLNKNRISYVKNFEETNIKDITVIRDKIILREKNTNILFYHGIFKRFNFKIEPKELSTSIAIDTKNNVYFGTSIGFFKNNVLLSRLDSSCITKVQVNNDTILIATQMGYYLYYVQANKFTNIPSLNNKKLLAVINNSSHFIISTDNEIISLNQKTLKTDFYFTTKFFNKNLSINNISINKDYLYVSTNNGYFFIRYIEKENYLKPQLIFNYNNTFINLGQTLLPKIEQKKKITYSLLFTGVNKDINYSDYSLNIYDDDGNIIQANNNLYELPAHFYYLSYGKYKINFIEKNTKLIIDSYKFEVLPYWYQTLLFRTVIGLALLIFVLILTTYYNNKKQKSLLYTNNLNLELFENQIKSYTLQLNTHLIFNLLNPLNYFILSGKNADALSYLKTFTRFMRLLFNKTLKQYHTIQESMDFFEMYIKIQQFRFNKKFTYTITNETSNSQEPKLPLLLVVPLVENSIEHGFFPTQNEFVKDKVDLSIKFSITDNELVIQIMNLTTEPPESFFKKGHSLEVVKNHLSLLKKIYGKGDVKHNVVNSCIITELTLPTNLY